MRHIHIMHRRAAGRRNEPQPHASVQVKVRTQSNNDRSKLKTWTALFLKVWKNTKPSSILFTATYTCGNFIKRSNGLPAAEFSCSEDFWPGGREGSGAGRGAHRGFPSARDVSFFRGKTGSYLLKETGSVESSDG